MVNTTLRDAFDRWKGALIDQDKQTTEAARHRAHARVTSMEDLIAETPADDIEGVGIKLALYVYMSGVDPEKADSAVEQVLSAYKDCVRVLGRDLLAEVKSMIPASQQHTTKLGRRARPHALQRAIAARPESKDRRFDRLF